MADLDKKLVAIGSDLITIGVRIGENPQLSQVLGTPAKDAAAQIKQAFIDDGWVRIHMMSGEVKSISVPKFDGPTQQFLTGQEWHDRFTKEINRDFPDQRLGESTAELIDRHVRAAAKKASGIE